MSKNVPALAPNSNVPRYDEMCRAISECYTVDECVHIADRSSALAAYCRQLNDTENENKLKEIKLRAWRRVAVLLSEIDVSGCSSVKDKVSTIRAALSDEANACLTDSRIYEMLRLGAVSDYAFEEHLPSSRGSVGYLISAANRPPPPTPEQLEAARKQQSLQAAKAEQDLREQRERAEAAMIASSEALLKEARERGFAEAPAGLTLHPKFRHAQKVFSFSMPAEVHEQLRQAAFDNHLTMWEILRQGLDAWFITHGYKAIGDLVPQAKTSKGPRRPGGFGGHR